MVVGLGNPEGKYFDTWHNLGFQAVDKFAESYSSVFKKKGNQMLAETKIKDNKIFILKPLTYMNLSGQAVLALSRKYKIPSQNIIVFVDDVYINIGEIRAKQGGGSAGHNGIKSINQLLKATDYTKIRLGAKPQIEIKGNTADYVLSKIPKEAVSDIQTSIDNGIAKAIEIITGEK